MNPIPPIMNIKALKQRQKKMAVEISQRCNDEMLLKVCKAFGNFKKPLWIEDGQSRNARAFSGSLASMVTRIC